MTMQFTHEGQEYRIAFRYNMQPQHTDKVLWLSQDVKVDIKETWFHHKVEAVLFRKVEGPRPNSPNPDAPWHWVPFETGVADCSKDDDYIKVKGRVIAVGRLMKKLGEPYRTLVRTAYTNRLTGTIDGETRTATHPPEVT